MTQHLDVIVVEDSTESCQAIETVLQGLCKLHFCKDIQSAKKALEFQKFNLMILDIHLPDGDGLLFFEETVRSSLETVDSPNGDSNPQSVLILTGRDELTSKVSAFNAGAVDYIVKPYDPLEFQARVLAQLRRLGLRNFPSKDTSPKLSESKFIRMDATTQTVRFKSRGGERSVPITSLEYRILHQLVRAEKAFLTREDLIQKVWGGKVSVSLRTIDTHICHLRTKLQGAPLVLMGVKGQGYSLNFVEQDKSNKDGIIESNKGNTMDANRSQNDIINLAAIESWKKMDSSGQKIREMVLSLLKLESSILSEILTASDVKAIGDLRASMHKLKSSTSQLGAQALSQACVSLENKIKSKSFFDRIQVAQEFEEIWKNTRACYKSLEVC